MRTYILLLTFLHVTAAHSRLFAKFIEAVLQPDLYDATLVGSTYSVEAYTHGLTLSLSGLRRTMGLLISTVASSELT